MNPVEKIQEDVHEMSELVRELHNVVCGSKTDQSTGLAARVRELEERVDRLDKFKDRAIIFAICVLVPTGAGLSQITEAIVHALK